MMVPLFMRERPGEKLFPWRKIHTLLSRKRLLQSELQRNNRESENCFLTKVNSVRNSTEPFRIAFSLFDSTIATTFPQRIRLVTREINATKGGLVLIITMFGYLAGGYLGKKFGGKSVIIYSTTIGALVTAFWGLTESWWGRNSTLYSFGH